MTLPPSLVLTERDIERLKEAASDSQRRLGPGRFAHMVASHVLCALARESDRYSTGWSAPELRRRASAETRAAKKGKGAQP